jgi:outer membrane protein assembly factor BamD
MAVDPGTGVRRLLAAAACLAVAACASSTPDIATLTSNSDRTIWEAGQKALEGKQWENARQLFRRIVDGFPNSEHGPGARLAIAESYVREGGSTNDLLAVAAYREFLTLFPSHPKSDFAQFEIGEAYFRRRNGPDRDQTDTREALAEYQRLLDLYPGSPHGEKARERITETRQSLARAEFLAGYFYQRTREACRSAILRYEVVLRDYPDYRGLDEVLFRLGECLIQTGRGPEALPHLNRVVQEYPQGEWAGPARELLAAAPPVPPPAASAVTPGTAPAPEPAQNPPASPSPRPAP